MAHRYQHIAIVLVLSLNGAMPAHAKSITHTNGRAGSKTILPPVVDIQDAAAAEVVDGFLPQILCDGMEFKIWNEGMQRAGKSAVSEERVRKIFSENLFYSLMPGQEQKEFRSAIPGIFGKAEELSGEMADVAVFFSSTIHELYEQENKRLTDLGKPAYTKEDFLQEFGNGALKIAGPEGSANYKDWVDAKIASIARHTGDLKYGCNGNKNFIYRAGSKLGSVIDIDAFVIPATTRSAKLIAEVTENAKTSPAHERARENAPRAAVLADKTPETHRRAEEQYRPSSKPKASSSSSRSLRSQQMMGATFYFTPSESDSRYRGSKSYRLFDTSGRVIARVSEAFYNALKVQGAGVLADGRTVNYSRHRGGTPRYKVTDAEYGLGKSNNALKPWRSVALDFDYYRRRGIKLEIGQQIYIPSTDGLRIPGTNQYHDGFWEVADVGGAINGPRIDMFTGSMHWKDALAYVNNSSNYSNRQRNQEAAFLGDRRKQVTVKIFR
ncbi:MAG TPA: 3D domain-containing protein [Bdellovibrionota bacterium]|nr:3D domain-containing protein [Bdellovibrionota bacterium]